jgi:hypothetical protein
VGVLGKIVRSTSLSLTSIEQAVLFATDDSSALAWVTATILLITFMFVVEGMQEGHKFCFRTDIAESVRWQAVAVVLLFQAVMLFGVLRASSFIYFQF